MKNDLKQKVMTEEKMVEEGMTQIRNTIASSTGIQREVKDRATTEVAEANLVSGVVGVTHIGDPRTQADEGA